MKKVLSEITGSVWKIEVQSGARVEMGQTLLIVESMKMEIPVASPRRLRIRRVLVAAGAQVQPGTALAVGEYVD